MRLLAQGRTPLVAVVCVLCCTSLLGCGQDLQPLMANWERLHVALTLTARALRAQYEGAVAEQKALPPVGPDDAAGQGLMAQLATALDTQGSQLDALDASIQATARDVLEARRTERIPPVLSALEADKPRIDGLIAKISASRMSINALLAALKAHNTEPVAEAARIRTGGAHLDFTEGDFKPGKAEFRFDQPHTKATLDKLYAFVNGCPGLVVDIIGHASNEGSATVNKKLSGDRAMAVKNWLESKGVGPKKTPAVNGRVASVNILPEPDPAAPAAGSLPQGELESRRKNSRLSVEVVTACPEPGRVTPLPNPVR